MRKSATSILLALLVAGCASAPRPGARPAAPVPAPTPTAPSRVYTRADVTAAIDSLVAGDAFRTANWGILVVNPATGDTIASHNAAKLFVPASNTKLVTGATILTQLGPDFTWKTIIGTSGRVTGGVLRGDLVVYGRGDPTVSSRVQEDAMVPLRRIADSLAARGIRRIAGRILQGGDAFPGPRIGSGWQWDYLEAGYAAGVDELFFNEGTVRFVVRGAATPGTPPQVTTSPARTFPVVKMQAVTLSPVDSARSRIRLEVDSVNNEVIVAGYIAPGDSSVLTLTLQDPATAYIQALREALAERGITVDSLVTPGAMLGANVPVDTLFALHSAPLSSVLGEMMKPSQNQLAEMFLRTIGLERTGVGSPDSGLAVVRRQLKQWGVADDGHALRDGSGLTRNNFVSPESIVRLLHAMKQHEHFPIFFESLPIAGVDGTLRSRMSRTPADGNVRGKTGTLARASALSGYVRTIDGEELIFSLFCNNFTAPASAVTGMQNTIAVLLASLEWKR